MFKYYIEMKDFNSLIDNKQKAYEKLVKMSRNDYYTTGNLLDYLYHPNYYKLISIDLSRQTNTTIPQQINFTGKLDKDNGAAILVIDEKQQKTILNFSLDSLIITD